MDSKEKKRERIKRHVYETLESRYEKFVPDRMRYLNLYRNNDCFGYPSHWHSVNEIEFVMPVLNAFSVICDGKEIMLEENEILIIPHGHDHSFPASERYGERIVFIADLGLLHQFREYRSLFSFQIPLTKIDSRNPILQREMCEHIRRLEEEYFSENKMRNSCIYALVIQIFVMLARSASAKEGDGNGVLYPEKLAMVIEYMENHCAEKLILSKVGGLFGYTQQELSELMNSCLGLSFRQCLLNIRISRAEEYLSEKHEYSIGEIAQLCGYKNYNTFVRIFKEKKGCTPSEYRKNRY